MRHVSTATLRDAHLVSELADLWLERDPSKRPSTRQRDETIARCHITPYLGPLSIHDISPIDIQRLVLRWSEGEAPRTVVRQYAVLRAMFEYAVACDWINRSPCRSIRLPRADPLERPMLGPTEVSAIAGAMDARYRLMVWLGALLGLRWGEVAGLTVGAMDTERSVVVVRRQLDRDGKLSPPKSRAGLRTLSMPGGLAHLLDEKVRAAGIHDQTDAVVFTAPRGGRLGYSTWRVRYWLPAVERAGLPSVGFHDLRRANATALVAEQVDVKTAQVRLGHADPWMTLAVYARATTAADRDAADRLWERFRPPSP